jgi:hypothetical protein
MEMEDLYDEVANLNPPASLPREVVRQFNVARSAYLYSWFDYELATLAEEHSYTVVEMAIQHRARQEGVTLPPKATMAMALNAAVQAGWLTERDFEYGNPERPFSWKTDYIQFRNDLMHGRPHLDPTFSLQMMDFSLKLLTLLFPSNRTSESPA